MGGGYLVYLSDGDVPFFRVSFSPIFSRTGYQKKANFLEQAQGAPLKSSENETQCLLYPSSTSETHQARVASAKEQ